MRNYTVVSSILSPESLSCLGSFSGRDLGSDGEKFLRASAAGSDISVTSGRTLIHLDGWEGQFFGPMTPQTPAQTLGEVWQLRRGELNKTAADSNSGT